jgi:hypothetical protein
MPLQAPISSEVPCNAVTAATQSTGERLRGSWRWCCRLSLIEPLVAVAWHASFSHALDRRLPFGKALLIFNSLWLVYAADRLLDVHGLPNDTDPQTDRHRFASQSNKGLTYAWFAVCLATLFQASATLTLREWRGCLYLLFGTVVYLVALHWNDASRKWLSYGGKEVAITVLFTAGCTLFLWSNGRFSDELWLPTVLFGGLVLQNLVSLAHLERHVDRAQRSVSIFQGSNSTDLARILGPAVVLTASGAVLAANVWPGLLHTWVSPGTRSLLLGIMLSSGLLAGLVFAANRAKTPNLDKLHLLADVAVLAGTFPLLIT